MKRGFLISIFFMLTLNVLCQYNFHVVRGNIINEQTGLFVNGATVTIPLLEKTLVTNDEGYFVLGILKGEYIVTVVHPDFNVKQMLLTINSDTTLRIELSPLLRSLKINEAVITTNEINKLEIQQMGIERITPKTFNRLPVMAGEKDPVKAFFLLPGIQSGTEGTADLFVRGGTPDQNLYLLDNTPMYNSTHLMGFLSSFNPLSLGQIDLYKAGFPSRYGGRLSSILDAVSKKPTYTDFSGTINMGILSSKGNIEAPIIKDKLSFLISGRRTYFDLISRIAQGNKNYSSLNFYDIHPRLSLCLEKHEIDLWSYMDRDFLYTIDKVSENNQTKDYLYKRNKLTTFSWKYEPTENLRNLFHISTTGYDFQMKDILETPNKENNRTSDFKSTIHDFSIKDIIEGKQEKIEWEIGGEFINHHYVPASIKYVDSDSITSIDKISRSKNKEINVFASLNIAVNEAINFKLGLRNSNFINRGKSKSFIEPRISLSTNIKENAKIKTSYSRMSQPMHLLSTPGLGRPVDLWIPVNSYLKPETSNQFAIGYYHNKSILKQDYVFTVETYFKNMNNIIAYNDGYSSQHLTSTYMPGSISLDKIVTQGKGQSYGIEFMADKKTGKFSGWLSYTLSWTRHQFDELNNGEPFYARYDRRHDISIAGFYKINNKSEISFNWVFGTGQALTLPVASFSGLNFDYSDESPATYNDILSYSYLLLYENSERNAYRMIPYHRLDISYRRFIDMGKNKGILELGLYNVYNRQNPYYYYTSNVYGGRDEQDGAALNKRGVYSVSVFPILPSVSFQYSF